LVLARWHAGGVELGHDRSVRGVDYESDLNVVRSMLEAAGVSSEDFGRFGSGYPGVITPSRFDYAAAVPVLLSALPMVADPGVKEAVVRSLTHRGAKPAAAKLMIEEFKRAADPGVGWAIGNALDTVSDESVQDDLIELAKDQRYGKSRQMIVMRLGRFRRSDRLVEVLTELARDDDVALHGMSALQRMIGADGVEPLISSLLNDPSPAVVKAAKIQLRKVRAAQQRRRGR